MRPCASTSRTSSSASACRAGPRPWLASMHSSTRPEPPATTEVTSAVCTTPSPSTSPLVGLLCARRGPLGSGGAGRHPYLELLPAVDVADGQAVQLVQGVAGSREAVRRPGRGRAALAARPARSGSTSSTSTRRSAAGTTASCWPRIVGALDIDVEMTGGIRDDESLAAALATGCRRVNIGTAALEQPGVVRPGHRRRTATGSPSASTSAARTLAARGWTREGGDLYEVLARLDAEGCARYVVTDVTKDGMLAGPEPRAAARRLRRAPTGRSSPAAASPSSPTSRR